MTSVRAARWCRRGRPALAEQAACPWAMRGAGSPNRGAPGARRPRKKTAATTRGCVQSAAGLFAVARLQVGNAAVLRVAGVRIAALLRGLVLGVARIGACVG